MDKHKFETEFSDFLSILKQYVSDESKNWKIKGFIDIHKNIFTIFSA